MINSIVVLHIFQPTATVLPVISFLSSSDLQAVYTSTASMEPPPTQELFDNMDDAVSFAKLHAERHGYALTRANLIRDKRKEVRRLDLRCDKGGKKRGEGILQNMSTRMTECPFELRLYRINPESGLWKITVFDGSPQSSSSMHSIAALRKNRQSKLESLQRQA